MTFVSNTSFVTTTKPQVGDVVLVRWIDAEACDGWVSIDSFEDETPEIQTIGFVVLWGDVIVVLAGSFDPTNDNVRGDMGIPWSAVKEWRIIDVGT